MGLMSPVPASRAVSRVLMIRRLGSFQPGCGQDFIDADKQITLLVIILTGGDERKRWTKFGLVGYNFHGSRATRLVW